MVTTLCACDMQVRDNTGARIIFPTKDDDDQELIHIIGKEEAVRAAKEELEKAIKDLVSNVLTK